MRSISWLLIVFFLISAACSFDYGQTETAASADIPDITMTNLDYVRVSGGAPVVRVQAGRAERWEDKQLMKLDDLRFAQFMDGDTVKGTVGAAGRASVDLESGDVELDDGVQIFIRQEEMTIETRSMSWDDESRVLLGGDEVPVLIKRADGAVVQGVGFGADARRRTWEFAGPVSGSYVEEDPAPPLSPAAASAAAPAAAPDDAVAAAPEPIPGAAIAGPEPAPAKVDAAATIATDPAAAAPDETVPPVSPPPSGGAGADE
jgi:LPS export ABC transporter protein LptC